MGPVLWNLRFSCCGEVLFGFGFFFFFFFGGGRFSLSLLYIYIYIIYVYIYNIISIYLPLLSPALTLPLFPPFLSLPPSFRPRLFPFLCVSLSLISLALTLSPSLNIIYIALFLFLSLSLPRVALLCLLIVARGGSFFLEQPASSWFVWHPALEFLKFHTRLPVPCTEQKPESQDYSKMS